jgi:hypothetical protein
LLHAQRHAGLHSDRADLNVTVVDVSAVRALGRRVRTACAIEAQSIAPGKLSIPWGRERSGYASTFDLAHADFEAAWKNYLPQCTEAAFIEHRRQRAWTAWKYAMHDAGLPLPTQLASGRARCFCGAAINLAVTDLHVPNAHMDSQHA